MTGTRLVLVSVAMSPTVYASVNDADCAHDAEGFCASKRVMLTLGEDDAKTVGINLALGDIVTIRLERPLAIRTCEEGTDATSGEKALTYCGVGNGNQALLKVDVDERMIKMTPKLPPGLALGPGESATDALWHEHGNLQVVMASGQQITFDVRIRPPAQSVKQIHVSSPASAQAQRKFESECSAHMEKEASNLRRGWGDIEATSRRVAREKMTFALMGEERCKRGQWTAMQDLVWVRVTKVCYVDDRLYATAVIHNRGESTPFEIHELRLVADGAAKDGEATGADTTVDMAFEDISEKHDETKPGERKALDVTDIELRYGERVRAGVSVASAKPRPKRLALEVHELGGAQRVVRVGGIRF